jgi:hypothetical protein
MNPQLVFRLALARQDESLKAAAFHRGARKHRSPGGLGPSWVRIRRLIVLEQSRHGSAEAGSNAGLVIRPRS